MSATQYQYHEMVRLLIRTRSGGHVCPPVEDLREFLQAGRAWIGGEDGNERARIEHLLSLIKNLGPPLIKYVKNDQQQPLHALWDAHYVNKYNVGETMNISRRELEKPTCKASELHGEFPKLDVYPERTSSWQEVEQELIQGSLDDTTVAEEEPSSPKVLARDLEAREADLREERERFQLQKQMWESWAAGEKKRLDEYWGMFERLRGHWNRHMGMLNEVFESEQAGLQSSLPSAAPLDDQDL